MENPRRMKDALIRFLSLILIVSCFMTTGCAGKPPEPSAELQLGDIVLAALSEGDALEQLHSLLRSAEPLGYEPKTHLLGPTLVLTDSRGQTFRLELDVDSDLFRYEGNFYDYGPGNDNNAMPRLWELLELTGWPAEVKDAFPEWFASVGDPVFPTVVPTPPGAAHMDLWYPDWAYLEIPYPLTEPILDALKAEAPALTDDPVPNVEDTSFTLHIAYDDGREYDIFCMKDNAFRFRDFQTNQVFALTSSALMQTISQAIAQAEALQTP